MTSKSNTEDWLNEEKNVEVTSAVPRPPAPTDRSSRLVSEKIVDCGKVFLGFRFGFVDSWCVGYVRLGAVVVAETTKSQRSDQTARPVFSRRANCKYEIVFQFSTKFLVCVQTATVITSIGERDWNGEGGGGLSSELGSIAGRLGKIEVKYIFLASDT